MGSESLTSGQHLESLLWSSRRASEPSAWHGHVAFMHWLVHIVRPKVIVELGTERAVSYAAMCHAVAALGLSTRCYAIDTWQGDAHTGSYDDSIYLDVKAFNDQFYTGFSTLMRCLFDDALDSFQPGSIDLLHIDGLHTYEAVKHDFDNWLPKMSERGVILFHDIAVRVGDFGVWRLWEELQTLYPSFAFEHSAGLGVLAVGSLLPDEIWQLCAINEVAQVESTRRTFSTFSDAAYHNGNRDLQTTALTRRLAALEDTLRALDGPDGRHCITTRSTASFATILENGRRRADDVSLLVTTALAYRPQRLPFFLDMVRCFSEMPVRRVTFFILINTDDVDAIRVVEGMLDIYRSNDRVMKLRSVVGLDHPYALCWEHKSLFEAEFFPSDYTHFIYLEDDMRFNIQNLYYFLGAREVLRPFGLIPSFVRYEWNFEHNAAFATDQIETISQVDVPIIDVGDHYFAPMTSVYNACFVLDRELATEYVNSRSFGRDSSKDVFGWQISERAAMGLAFENVPEGYFSRYIVAVSKARHRPATCCWVQHWPGNFTNDAKTLLGSRRMDDIFIPGSLPD